MLILLVGVGSVLVSRAAGGGSAVGSAGQFVPTVRCSEIAYGPGFTEGNGGGGYRVILGAVSAPRIYIPGGARDPSSAPFSHWFKAGLVIRASTAVVTVSLPNGWRDRARIVWGAPGSPATALRFAPCPSPVGAWNGYAGGFLLRTDSACVPLIFAIGHRRATLRFGVGRHC